MQRHHPPARWLALDVFRALAVLWMIQGHTFTALMRIDLYTGPWVQLYSLLHGLTAPMFLLGAGLSYGVVMFGPNSGGSGRILRRAGVLLAVGTLLQLPAAPPHSIFVRRDLLAATLAPGALQLVAACLLVAEALRAPTRSRAWFTAIAAALTAVLAFTAPFVWNQQLSASSLFGSWLDGQNGSQFPFVPWAVFFLLGAIISGGFGTRLWRVRWTTPWIGAIGLAISAVCYALFLSGERLNGWYGTHSFWYSNPLFVSFRAGLVCAWLGALSLGEPVIARVFTFLPRLAQLTAALARHSLIAYVVHLILLYGTPFTPGLARGGARFDVLETTAAFGFVLVTTIGVVFGWKHWQVLRAAAPLVSPTPARASDAPHS